MRQLSRDIERQARQHHATVNSPQHLSPCDHNNDALTSVAEMPGYPTNMLLFGGPETRTKAATRSFMFCRTGYRHQDRDASECGWNNGGVRT